MLVLAHVLFAVCACLFNNDTIMAIFDSKISSPIDSTTSYMISLKPIRSDLSPFDYGLSEAKSDTDRYYVLYNTHVAALAAGVDVDYSGIDSLTIEIPANAKRIPLTRHNDFHGMVLHVKNVTKQCVIFEMIRTPIDIQIDKQMLSGKNFSSIPELSDGLCMLILKDETPWVNQRKDHNYPAIRRDLLFLSDGIAQNQPVASYSTDTTKPKCSYYKVTADSKIIENLTIIRDSLATFKSKCFYISGENNLIIRDISIYTPKNDMNADEAIIVMDCANVTFKDVTIEGSYSQINHSGYGISMNNVWNSQFIRLVGHANWGIFGTNNMSKVYFEDCDVNRFDIHCYGRDITFKNCQFHNMYNQFSSVFGNITFDGCHFSNYIPVLFETSYNAYTGFDLILKDCIFDVSEKYFYLISAGLVDDEINGRPELHQKCWPNISIENLTINVPDSISRIELFHPRGRISPNCQFDYLSNISIDKMQIVYSGSERVMDFYLSSFKIGVLKPVDCSINRIRYFSTDNLDRLRKGDSDFKDIHFHSNLFTGTVEQKVKVL